MRLFHTPECPRLGKFPWPWRCSRLGLHVPSREEVGLPPTSLTHGPAPTLAANLSLVAAPWMVAQVISCLSGAEICCNSACDVLIRGSSMDGGEGVYTVRVF